MIYSCLTTNPICLLVSFGGGGGGGVCVWGGGVNF